MNRRLKKYLDGLSKREQKKWLETVIEGCQVTKERYKTNNHTTCFFCDKIGFCNDCPHKVFNSLCCINLQEKITGNYSRDWNDPKWIKASIRRLTRWENECKKALEEIS